MNKSFARQQLVGLRRRHFDVIADHLIVPDLEVRRAAGCRIFLLQTGDQLAAVVAQRDKLIKLRRIASRDEISVARQQRQIGGKRALQPVDQRMMFAKRLRRGRKSSGMFSMPPATRRASLRPRCNASRMAARSRGPPRPSAKPRQRAFEIGRVIARLRADFRATPRLSP